MPSYAEMTALLGFRSKSGAYKAVQKLIGAGVLARDAQGKVIPKRLERTLRMLGVVEAGFPSPAEEELCDTLTLDDYLIGNREATYMLRVKGDSMIDAGILDGDLVIVERTNEAHVGDIVIAEVDGEWTMKYLRRRGDQYYLQPANKQYKPIVPNGDLKIAAVVTSVIRKVR